MTKPGAPARPLSLGVIFLTLYIDLVGFSIIFPLGPDLIGYYLRIDGQSGALRGLVEVSNSVAQFVGKDHAFATVLLGGIVTSLYAILQFVFSPIWGSLSDRRGRRPVLVTTIAGTAAGYVVWFFSGSFWLFLASRLLAGAFSGNLSVATAAVADVTTRQERSRAMGVVGAAFGLGLITGPALGGVSMALHLDFLTAHPALAKLGINPFSAPALISFAMCLLNIVWIVLRFRETLGTVHPVEPREGRTRNPVKAILMLDNPAVRRANIVAFVYSVAFVTMETLLTYFAADRFGFTVPQQTELLVFLGFCSILTQGYIVRKILKHTEELRVLAGGLILSFAGLLVLGLARWPSMLYVGVALLAVGAGLVNPSTSGLISLYCAQSEQGRVMGVYRSLGSLSRAFTPLAAGIAASVLPFHYSSVLIVGAFITLVALRFSARLPKPEK